MNHESSPRSHAQESSPVAGRDALPRWLSLAGLGLLLLYVITRLYTDKPGDYAGQLLSLLAGFGLLRYRVPLRSSVVIQLLFIAIVVQLISWGMGHWLSPELAERSPKVERLASWFFLLPVALFIGQAQNQVFRVWGVAVAVLLLAPWVSGGGWEEIRRGLEGGRVGFHILNQQHTSMLFGVVLIGLLVFFYRFQRAVRGGRFAWLAVLYWVLILCVAVTVLISQTRAVWLALPLTAVIVLAMACYLLSPQRRRAYLAALASMRWKLAAILLVLGVLLPAMFSNVLLERVGSEGPLAEVTGQVQAQESTRVRLNTWTEALHWVVQRPLFGWGGHGRSAVVQHSEGLSADEKARFRHLHSSYMDTLVNFGIAGLLVWFALLWALTRAIVDARKASRIGADFLWFWIAFLVYWLVVNAFESYMYYQTGIYAFSLVAGGYLALVTVRPAPEAQAADAAGT